jgi:hypothetical protein
MEVKKIIPARPDSYEYVFRQAFVERSFLSHYFEAVLPDQFDAYVWFAQTSVVTPLAGGRTHGAPDTYPFGL